MGTADRYRDILRRAYGGKKLVLVGGPVVMLGAQARMLSEFGVRRPFLLGSETGTGAMPDPDEVVWHSMGIRGRGVMDAFNLYEAAMADPGPEACAALDAFDPDGEAEAAGLIILSEVPRVAGRRRFGARQPRWIALEDKVEVDRLWDELGVPRVASRVVPARLADLQSAAASLDRGSGTVWAGDARDGVHGGATRQRWVRTPEEANEAAGFLATTCDRVRVMPFLEGLPCSIHGIVCPDGVAVFRPVELLVMPRTDRGGLAYGGTATYWDPDPRDRDEMRAVARRVGLGIAEREGYRGAFTVDGILTEDGFRPTELNPRIGHGLLTQAAAVPELALPFLALAAIEESCEFCPSELEELVVSAADARRQAAGHAVLPARKQATETHRLVCDEATGGYRRVRGGEEPVASLALGPSVVGSFLAFSPRPGHLSVGHPVAPALVRALAWADRELDTGVGPLRPASVVR